MGEMTREMVESVKRVTARELLESASPDHPGRLLLAVEVALNNEWWRGYFAGLDEARAEGKHP